MSRIRDPRFRGSAGRAAGSWSGSAGTRGSADNRGSAFFPRFRADPQPEKIKKIVVFSLFFRFFFTILKSAVPRIRGTAVSASPPRVVKAGPNLLRIQKIRGSERVLADSGLSAHL